VTRKRKGQARTGWVLAEVLCSVVIVSVLAANIIGAAGMMARASESGLRTRTRALDLSSITGEMEFVNSSHQVYRGVWLANAEICANENRIGRIDVSVSSNPSDTREMISWIAWDIKGRTR